MLAYGTPADLMDESIGVPQTTTYDCMAMFVQGVQEIFGEKYLGRPTDADVKYLLARGEACGFPGMLGSHVGKP
jgi:hypothetical protein